MYPVVLVSRCLAFALFVVGIISAVRAFSASSAPVFETQIQPLLSDKCAMCHSGTAPKAGLDLSTASGVLTGSANGPVILKGSATSSKLFQLISTHRMPPKGVATLTEEQIRLIGEWIDSGAAVGDSLVTAKPATAKPNSSNQVGPPALNPEAEQAKGHLFDSGALPDFENDVRAIFAAHCAACHGGASPAAGLDLSSLAGMMRGSNNGPVAAKGASERSLLVKKVRLGQMPPPAVGKPLSEAEIVRIVRWIDLAMPDAPSEPTRAQVASVPAPVISDKDRSFWSFRSPVRPAVPDVKETRKVRTPIDAFILSQLEAKGLTFASEAARLTLMRRAYLDLTGLPPTPQEVQEYMADRRADAYDQLIEKLLASPQYGEQWGRLWLDVAGYADTKFIDNDQSIKYVFPNTGMWRYRDYVIRSFSEDKPYDRFLVEQLAGDELVDWRHAPTYTPEIRDALTATAYLRNVVDKRGYDAIFLEMENVSSGLLGLSVGCARCHDHKYDPIPQRDYYRMAANFAPVFMYKRGPKEDVLPNISASEVGEIDRYNAEIDRPIAALTQQLDGIRSPHEKKLFEAKLSLLPPQLRTDLTNALRMEASQRDPIQSYLIQRLGDSVALKPEEVDSTLSEAERSTCSRLMKQIEGLRALRRGHGVIPAAWEEGSPIDFHLLFRGDVKTPGPAVQPGLLTVLTKPGQNDTPAGDPKLGSSGRRLAFARWLTSRDNPLSARVIVNRIWQAHFGKGIVATADNFGRMGTPPTHPELLDWLAVDFMENGWKVKRLQKMIMTSAVYRQSSSTVGADGAPLAGQKVDPANSLLWRMNLRRLDAEDVRDSALAIAGNLDLTMGGPPVPIDIGYDGLTTVADKQPASGPFEKIAGAYTPNRRSIYLFARRNYPVTFLEVFDYPIMAVNCTRRTLSATPLQALAMMNSQFIMDEADIFATRVTKAAGDGASWERKIDTAFRIALSRPPTGTELTLSQNHLDKIASRFRSIGVSAQQADNNALSSLCQMLMATNEVLYIE
jgi:mono/diheme cytochrome c family protein